MEGWMNGKTIVGLIVVVLLALGGYWFWQHHREEQADGGEVHWVSGKPSPEEEARFKKENAGETADGNSEHKTLTARQDDATGFQDGAAAAGQTPATSGTGSTTASPPAATTPAATPVIPAAAAAVASALTPSTTYPAPAGTSPSAASTSSYAAAPASMPASDSQSPNAPNGMRFGGSGTYQWYRQGNLTWRIDTASGRSCIIYATMEELRKQIVYSHGCGRNA